MREVILSLTPKVWPASRSSVLALPFLRTWTMARRNTLLTRGTTDKLSQPLLLTCSWQYEVETRWKVTFFNDHSTSFKPIENKLWILEISDYWSEVLPLIPANFTQALLNGGGVIREGWTHFKFLSGLTRGKKICALSDNWLSCSKIMYCTLSVWMY